MLLPIVPTASSRRDRMATKLRSRNGIIRTMRGEATDQLRDCQIGRNSQSVLAIAHGWDAFSVVLLLTPHSPDAAQHAGSFVEPNILLGAASARQTLYDRSRRKADVRRKIDVR